MYHEIEYIGNVRDNRVRKEEQVAYILATYDTKSVGKSDKKNRMPTEPLIDKKTCGGSRDRDINGIGNSFSPEYIKKYFPF